MKQTHFVKKHFITYNGFEVRFMLEIILKCVLVLILIVGIEEIVRFITIRLVYTSTKNKAVIIIPIKGRDEEAEFTLRSTAEKTKWLGEHHFKAVICINDNMDDETEEICRTICGEYSFMRFYEFSEIEHYLKSIGLQEK